MMFPKQNKWRNQKYLDWVKTQDSVLSGQPADDAHHVKGHGLTGGTKAPDWAVIPLTREEHTDIHNDLIEWEKRYGCQLFHLFKFMLNHFDEIQEFFN